MTCTSSTQRDFFKPLINDKFTWQLALIPQKSAASPTTVLYGANICIFKSTQEKEDAAWEFLKWLSLKEQAAYWAIHSSYMPLRKSVAEMPEMQAAWKKDPQGKQAFDLIQYAKPEPNVRGWQDARGAIGDAVQAIIAGTKTPEQAVKDLDTQTDAFIQKKKI
jgi:ABC-type glycerol-3-phosphate transport system substrate-binding protein